MRDLNPLISGYELPPSLPSEAPDSSALLTQFATGNISLVQLNTTESVQLDAELQRWQIGFTKPLGNNWNLRLELPYLRIYGGQLDRSIESWHHTFGLPNGNRDSINRNQLLVQYAQHGITGYRLAQPENSIGDATLRIGHALGANTARHTMFWLSIKFATGNTEKLTGSGAADVALSISSSQSLTSHVIANSQLSLSILGNGDRLTEQQRAIAWSGALGVNVRLSSHWYTAIQLDGHSKVFNSDLRALGNVVQLSLGPRYQSRNWQTSLLLSEDIAVDTAPDVQFQLNIARNF